MNNDKGKYLGSCDQLWEGLLWMLQKDNLTTETTIEKGMNDTIKIQIV